MKIYRCDRCLNIFDNEPDETDGFGMYEIIKGTQYRVDLCPACLSGLAEYMQAGRAKIPTAPPRV